MPKQNYLFRFFIFIESEIKKLYSLHFPEHLVK